MDVISADMSGQEGPTAMVADFVQAFQDDLPAGVIEDVWGLKHSASGLLLAMRVGLGKRSTELVLRLGNCSFTAG